MITVASIFRDSAGYIPRYFAQIGELTRFVDVRLLLVYGDCTDDTGDLLTEYAWESGLEVSVGQCDHGGPRFGSIDHPQRWDQIARVVRYTLDRVHDPGDALVWVESDLLWDAPTMAALLGDLEHVPAVAPLLLADGSTRFYDTWGYRKDGEKFAGQPPYYHGGNPDPVSGLVKIDSCGSCWATTGDAWRDWSGHWPYPAGGDLWLDPRLTVRHPDC